LKNHAFFFKLAFFLMGLGLTLTIYYLKLHVTIIDRGLWMLISFLASLPLIIAGLKFLGRNKTSYFLSLSLLIFTVPTTAVFNQHFTANTGRTLHLLILNEPQELKKQALKNSNFIQFKLKNLRESSQEDMVLDVPKNIYESLFGPAIDPLDESCKTPSSAKVHQNSEIKERLLAVHQYEGALGIRWAEAASAREQFKPPTSNQDQSLSCQN